MTHDELDALADSALHDLDLDDTAVEVVQIEDDLWRINIAGVSLSRPVTSVFIRPSEYADPNAVVAAIRNDLRKSLCPLCESRAVATPHTENGSEMTATDVDCERCEKPYTISWPLALTLRQAWESGHRSTLERLPDIQDAIRASAERLWIDQDSFLGIADQGRRIRRERE